MRRLIKKGDRADIEDTVDEMDKEDIVSKLKRNAAKIRLKESELETLRLEREMLLNAREDIRHSPTTKKYDCNGVRIRLHDTVKFAETGKFYKDRQSIFWKEGFVTKEYKVQIEILYKTHKGEARFYKRLPRNLMVEKEKRM